MADILCASNERERERGSEAPIYLSPIGFEQTKVQ